MEVFVYIFFLTLGGFIGYRRLLKPGVLNRLDMMRNGVLLSLLFVMGVNIGLDKTVITNFGTIGFQALVLAGLSVLFSIIGVRLVASRVFRNKEDAR